MSMTSSLHSALRATCTAAQSRCHMRCPTSHIRSSSSFAAFTFEGIRFQRYFALHLRRRSFIQTDRSIRKNRHARRRERCNERKYDYSQIGRFATRNSQNISYNACALDAKHVCLQNTSLALRKTKRTSGCVIHK